MSDISRRTVVRGIAWTTPVIAVSAGAPAFATSQEPPPPVINFGGACANTGAVQKGCGTDKSLQVPLTLSNPGTTDIVFQITSMYTCNNCAAAPSAPGDGVFAGLGGIFSTPDHSAPSHNDCGSIVGSACPGGLDSGNVLVPAGTTATYWIVSPSTGASSNFQSRISWRLLDATTCAELSSGQAFTSVAISPNNCNGR